MFIKTKIKLIQRLIYWWDVIFTYVDDKQLLFWMRLKTKLGELEALNSRIIVDNSRKPQIIVDNSRKSSIIVDNSRNVVFERDKPICCVDKPKNSAIMEGEDKIIIKYKIRRKCGQ